MQINVWSLQIMRSDFSLNTLKMRSDFSLNSYYTPSSSSYTILHSSVMEKNVVTAKKRGHCTFVVYSITTIHVQSVVNSQAQTGTGKY